MVSALLIATALLSANPMQTPGDHTRNLKVDGRDRSYLVHVPTLYDGKTPTPVVLALHGAAMNGPMMSVFSGLNQKADDAGFIAVYPSGGAGLGIFLTWNAAGRKGKDIIDDVSYIRAVLNDLGGSLKIDPKRVYATGMSNGGMMCYLLAAELSDRIAAIAPIGGTMVFDKANPKRPVSVIHFHGTADTFVPFKGPGDKTPGFAHFKSVDDSIQTWVKIDGCNAKPETVDLPDTAHDGTSVRRKTYRNGKDGAEVALVIIEGGGHTWPGQEPAVGFIGKSTKNISANDLLWEFFHKHPLK